ncbi:DUF2255 family protein [Cumulibacter soli]|uniref:DUF2255 family protein n=1 Tax=Cumulibacter soli TaxID=2546344 RepID=UPI001068659C|nr:DUF2255 family protein [Cumulibacter soli]
MDPNQWRGQTCTVVTHGRYTGAEHLVRVWFVVVHDRFYAAARGGLTSDWLRNALHAGELEMRAGKVSCTGNASLAPESDIPEILDAYAEKYRGHGAVIAAWRANPPTFVRAEATDRT